MSRRFVFIVNPISGTGNKGLLQQKIAAFAAANGFSYTLFPAHREGDYADVQQHIRQHGITDVVIAGGDGTINGAIGYLRNTGVCFGIIPCGSGNGLAYSAGLSKNYDVALHTINSGRAVWVDAFTVNGRFASMLCGLGFDAQVAHDFANDPRRGMITYIRKIVRHFFRAPVYRFELRFGTTSFDLDAYFVSIANSNQYGNHFTIAPRASLSDGLLDVVIATRQPRLQLLLRTLSHVVGWNRLQDVVEINKNLGVVYFQTDALQVENKGGAPLHLDGDPAPGSAFLNVQVLKHCYMMMQP